MRGLPYHAIVPAVGACAVLTFSITGCLDSRPKPLSSQPGSIAEARVGKAASTANLAPPRLRRARDGSYVASLAVASGEHRRRVRVRLRSIGYPGLGRRLRTTWLGPGQVRAWTSETHGQYQVDFRLKGRRVGLIVWSRGGRWRPRVDGHYIEKRPRSAGSDYAFHALNIRLNGGAHRRHRIRVELSGGAWLAGMTVGSGESIAPTRRSRRPRTYWLGDSFFVGGGSRYPGFTDLVHVAGARVRAADVVVDALGGTGYLARNRGAGFPNYMTRLKHNLRRISPRPDMVVVGGSINDVRYGRDRVRRAAARLFAYLARVAPSTDVVAIPFTNRFPPPRGIEKVMDGVADAAREAPNVTLLPLSERVARLRHNDSASLARLQRGDGHPSPRGHAVFGRVIGDFLSDRLRR